MKMTAAMMMPMMRKVCRQAPVSAGVMASNRLPRTMLLEPKPMSSTPEMVPWLLGNHLVMVLMTELYAKPEAVPQRTP